MSVLGANSLRSNSSSFNSPITFETSGGTQNGTLSRAWVNFNGQGAVAIRANFNVNSITDSGTGNYTVNITNAMTDANYIVNATASGNGAHPTFCAATAHDVAPTTTALRVYTARTGGDGRGGATIDSLYVSVSIF